MKHNFKDHISTLIGAPDNQKCLVAVSGGVDSVVLAHLMQQSGYTIGIAHMNYKLRGTDSDLDAVSVHELAKNMNVPYFSKTAPIAVDAAGIQEKARDLRYNWFKQLQSKHHYDYVLTAHHADDQLETLFMRLSRGSGLEGLGGIRDKKGSLVRPLLPFSKEDIITYAKANNIEWREDVSNASTGYLRNAIRHQVVPAFLALSAQTKANTLTSLQHLQDGFHALSSLVDQIKSTWQTKKSHIVIPFSSFETLKPQRFWLHHLFSPFGFDAMEVAKLLQTHAGKKTTSGTHVLLRERDHFVLTVIENQVAESSEHYQVNEDGITFPISLTISNSNNNTALSDRCVVVDASKLLFPLTLRHWQEGDVFYPVGMTGKKKLSKYFKDAKMTAHEKQNQWVLCHNNDIVWVVGKRLDRRFVSTDNASTLQIRLT